MHHNSVVEEGRRRRRGGWSSRMRRLLQFQRRQMEERGRSPSRLLSLRGTDPMSPGLRKLREQELSASPVLRRRRGEVGEESVGEGMGEGRGEELEEGGSKTWERLSATLKNTSHLFSPLASSTPPSAPSPSPPSTPSPSSPSSSSPTTTPPSQFPQQMGPAPFPQLTHQHITSTPPSPYYQAYTPPHTRQATPGLPAPVLRWMCRSCGSPILA